MSVAAVCPVATYGIGSGGLVYVGGGAVIDGHAIGCCPIDSRIGGGDSRPIVVSGFQDRTHASCH